MNRRQNYHYGNLQATFLDQACKILEQDGLSNISVRKISETIGVSHTAFKNHFNNLTGLYTAMVTRGYADLAKMMKSKTTDKSNRNDRRSAALLGYVEFASTYPALYELMFSRDRFANNDPSLMKEVGACFEILSDVARELNWYKGLPDEVNGKSQVALWSLVHGYAQLVTAKRFKKENMKGLSITDILPKTD